MAVTRFQRNEDLTLEQLISSLTIETAKLYEAETDKQVWIEYNLLDPNNLSRRHANVVEDALITLLD